MRKYNVTVDGQIYKIMYERRNYGDKWSGTQTTYTWVKVEGAAETICENPLYQRYQVHSLPGDPYPRKYFPVGLIREGIRSLLASGANLASRPKLY